MYVDVVILKSAECVDCLYGPDRQLNAGGCWCLIAQLLRLKKEPPSGAESSQPQA